MNKEIWLWLLLVMQPHNPKTMQLVEQYGGVLAAAEAIRDGRCEALDEEERSRAVSVRNKEVSAIFDDCAKFGIRVITIEDGEYPECLRCIYNPPVVLFVQGSLEGIDDAPTIAVVGTRNPSRYAERTGKTVCTNLASVGMVIISGLAVGLDTIAHQCALSRGARTIGVLACGNLVDYPAASRALKQGILSSGGALVSELPPRMGTSSEYFKYRNRIISGLALGTFIVEAPEHSGCLLTAEHTIQQDRELFCLSPFDGYSPRCSGVIPLLRDGAVPVYNHLDILYAYKHRLFSDIEFTEEPQD